MQMQMKSTMSSDFAFLLLQLLAIAIINISLCNGSSYGVCIESEREALLKFKGDLKDPSKRLANWTRDSDCCTWAGVVCDNLTGHVLKLRLQNPKVKAFGDDFESESVFERDMMSTLGGKINPSLLAIKHLSHFDLSFNDFRGIQIPRFLGSMRNLRYLDLSQTGFIGSVPPQLGNLSNLQYLGLNQIFTRGLYVQNLNWLSGLTLLHYLDLTGVNLRTASDWLLSINKLPHLITLRLSSCELHQFPVIPFANFSSLATLALRNNRFHKLSIPSWVSDLNDLVNLDLSSNNFRGPIPAGLQNLTSLKYLDLAANNFFSSIPNWLYRFSHLEYLSLRNCSLGGKILGNIGNLTYLKKLDLSFNLDLQGKIPSSFERLCNLKSIALSFVNLSQDVSEISNIFSRCVLDGLESLDLSYSQIFGHLTDQFIRQLKIVETFDLSHNNISGSVPTSLGELSSLRYLVFSYNKLNGTLLETHFTNLSSLDFLDVSENSLTLNVSLDWIPPFQLSCLQMVSCQVGPQFPLWLSSQKFLRSLDISKSRINDTIPSWFWKSSSMPTYFNLSHNQIGGSIPNLNISFLILDFSWNNFSGQLPLVTYKYLSTVDLSNNAFSGSISHFVCTNESNHVLTLNLENNLLSEEIPDCWLNWKTLAILNLCNNNFVGNFPSSLGSLSFLRSLRLHRNHLSGTIPLSLQNCTNLGLLDLSHNEFTGNVSKWIGKVFFLQVLNLRSNKFHGLLSHEICDFRHLQILDLSDNNLSGPIPRCISNLSAMATTEKAASSDLEYFYGPGGIIENALVVMKGRSSKYSSILNLLRAIDLSKNNFSGEIPTGVTNLTGLQSLNLSQNSFTGIIPKRIGVMKSLESMDFSSNQLFGAIPQSLSNLSFLSYLNLSNNHLTGKIPLGTQLQGFDPSVFAGNELCGPPLPECPRKTDNENGGDKEGNEHEVKWFYVSMALGFVVGFWGLVAPLFLNRRWRHIYFGFLNQLGDKLCIIVVRRFY